MRAWLPYLCCIALMACKPKPEEDTSVPEVAFGDAGCVSCHEGIEQIHDVLDARACVVCHGGDGQATTKGSAHVAVPANWEAVRGDGLPPSPHGFIKDMAPDQLDQLDPAYVRFINPGDIRAVDQTCGTCHAEQAKNQPFSVMTTNAGHYFPTLFLAGIQTDRLAHYASYPASNPDCDTTIAGAVCEVETIVPPTAEETEAALLSGDRAQIEELAHKHYLSKNCNTCHQAGYPRNDSPGLYRSSGCTSCHVLYAKDGTYQGGDPTIARGSPVHMAKHEITTAIPVEQCATCHFQGGRIGMIYRGIREGGFGAPPENAETIDETLNGRAPGFYVVDEDTTNDIDETPPDVHYSAGMVCVDCHVDGDVHGTGQILSSSKQQVGIRCEDCHGTVREPVAPGDDGKFTTHKGRKLPQLQAADGEIFLIGKVDGAKHVVPQVADILAAGSNHGMMEAMGEDANGWSHTDSVTCDTCHTSYVQTCIGCHVSVDFRLSQTDYQTGTSTPGLTKGGRTWYSLEHLLLGTAPDGRVQTVHASQQVQMAVYGAEAFGTSDGELLMGGEITDASGNTKAWGEFRTAFGTKANNGFTPFFQHATTRAARGCDDCHRLADTPEEADRIRGVYGHGTGEFMLQSPDGSLVDGLQYLDVDGNPTTTWVHEGTGPLAPDVYDRAWGVLLEQ